VVSLSAENDNTIYQDDVRPGETSAGNFGHLFSGWTLENSDRGGHDSWERRALIRFDVADFVQSGSIVDSVVLYLSVTRSHPNAGPRWFKLHRLTAGWGEGASSPAGQGGDGTQAAPPDATWLHRYYPDSLWTNEGGDFLEAASGSARADLPGRRYRWGNTPEMTADVQGWVVDPESNFGWIVVGEKPLDPAVSPSTKRFASRENLETQMRPTLRVYFTRP
jgi:hypothetical protein